MDGGSPGGLERRPRGVKGDKLAKGAKGVRKRRPAKGVSPNNRHVDAAQVVDFSVFYRNVHGLKYEMDGE